LLVDLKAGRVDRFRYVVFDVLYCEGFDLTKVVLKGRKDLLQRLLAILPPGSPIRFSEHLDADGPTMLEHACRFELEGIVSKWADLPYRSVRGGHWIKSKCLERQEFIILGYIPSTAASRSVGTLALGYHDNQNLIYAGRVGTGWPQEPARSLRDELETISATKPSFAKPLPAGAEKNVRWVEPRPIPFSKQDGRQRWLTFEPMGTPTDRFEDRYGVAKRAALRHARASVCQNAGKRVLAKATLSSPRDQSALGKRRIVNSMRPPESSRQDSISVM